jgi:transposase
MFGLSAVVRVYLAKQPADMRKSFDGLAALASDSLSLSMIVLEHIRPKDACRACEGNVVIAERLPEPIEKGLPGPGLMAHVAVGKYADHLPLYRQEAIDRRFGLELSRSTKVLRGEDQ